MRTSFEKKVVVEQPNALEILRYEFVRLNFSDPNACYIVVEYVLGTEDEKGAFTPTGNPRFVRRVEIRNNGTEDKIRKFLESSGLGAEDLYTFDYHDLLKICKEDAETVLGVD